VSVTFVFAENCAEHVPGQLIPAGLLVTVPVPVAVTVNGYVLFEKFAPTDSAPFMSILQPPVPEQAPVQPVKL
jgi:hypothetical protein